MRSSGVGKMGWLMAKKKSKSKAKKKEQQEVKFAYPQTPHVLGLDWIELPVNSVSESLSFYLAMGFQARPSDVNDPRVALGGYVIRLVEQKVSPGGPRITFRVAVDHIVKKYQQLSELDFKVSSLRESEVGGSSFDVQDPDGYSVRFTGPTRRSDDKDLD